jgi:hypothetical protein
MPMLSRSVRRAGNRHSCGDTPLMPRARHAGPARDAMGGGAAFPGGGVAGTSPPKAASLLGISVWKRCPERLGARHALPAGHVN